MAKSTTAVRLGSNGNGGNLGGVPADSILTPGTFVSVNVPTEIVGSEVNRWFLAFDQGFESAAIHLYRRVPAL